MAGPSRSNALLVCSLLALFLDESCVGLWGKGSRLAFDTTVQQHQRIFVVTAIHLPPGSRHTHVYNASLFDTVFGHWMVSVKQKQSHAA